MKRFTCCCGSHVYFDNTHCVACNRILGFDPVRMDMVAVQDAGDGRLPDDTGREYQYCRNRIEYDVCNWFTDGAPGFCMACEMNEVIPDLGVAGNKLLWYRLERAKRRLLYSLLCLQLPMSASEGRSGLRFHFLEDKRRNPNAPEDFVATGHNDGVITINVAEADTIARNKMRQRMQERYRTLLGHFRHEAGHYFFNYLVSGADAEFARLFGDPTIDYPAAMRRHYETGAPPNWELTYVSAYATSHPWEDWAEIFAHYLHITDTLDTMSWAMPKKSSGDWIRDWLEQSVGLNEICLSLGVNKAYPFVLNETTIEKLRFIEQRMRVVNEPQVRAGAAH